MNKLKDLSFEEFKELVGFLKFSSDETEFHNITLRMKRFMKNLDAIQCVLLDNMNKEILNNEIEEAESNFNAFKKSYPELEIDPEGKQELTQIKYFEIALQSCELLFETAKNHIDSNCATRADKEIFNAKTLTPFINMTGKYEYPIKKFMYFKECKQPRVSPEQLSRMENAIQLLIGNGNVMGKFINYIYKRKDNDVQLFIDHFAYRLELALRDKNLDYPANREFVENLKKAK